MKLEQYKQIVHDHLGMISRELVLPLYLDVPNGPPLLMGSAFFVKSARHRYLVSAKHVFYFETERPRHLFCFVGKAERTWMSGEVRYFDNDGPGGDPFDVAIMQLSDRVPEFKGLEARQFTPCDELHDSWEGYESKEFAVTGFPLSKNKPSGSLKTVPNLAYGMLQRSSASEKYQALGVNPESHIVLDFDQSKEHELTGVDGPPRKFPNPRGISGAPVFSYTLDPDRGVKSVIEGVAIEHHVKHTAIVCTRIGAVLNLIHRMEARA